ncbi:MAG: type II secretion system protein GspN [Myxococcota bacterium]|nr:type II secretion system protein GspN [Myxococcota bacterium]
MKQKPWARALSLAFAAIALTALMAAWLFPYQRVAYLLSAHASVWTGFELQIGELGPTLSWAGPGLEARNVRATLPGGDSLVLPSLFVRPAWTPRWLIGDSRLAIAVDGGALGRFDGQVGLGSGGSLSGRLDEVRVDLVPLDQLVPGLSMKGLLSGQVELAVDEEGEPVGRLEVEFSDGSLLAPGLPLPLPYERLSSDIELGGETRATIHALAIAGPMLSATLEGTVGRAALRGAEPLNLDMQIQRVGRALQPLLSSLGIELSPAGPTHLEIIGSLARPTFR